MNIQVKPPIEPARFVLTIARAALMLAANEEPPLNPSQPTQRSVVPRRMWLAFDRVVSREGRGDREGDVRDVVRLVGETLGAESATLDRKSVV